MTGEQPISGAPLLTVPEVAKRLRLSQRTVRRLIESGDLVCLRFGRAVRVSEEDLAVYLAKCRQIENN